MNPRCHRIALFAVVAALGGCLWSDVTWRKRKYERDLRDRVESIEHLVDVGVELRVVVADPNGEELLKDRPKLRILRTHRAGGIVDTTRGQIVMPSQRRVIWYCSLAQEPIILHRDTEPLGIQACGSEGAGKTTILPKWFYWRWLEHLGERREGGLVAPTKKRLRMFLRELRAAYPKRWYSYTKSEDLITMCDQTRIQMVSAHQKSADEGSPVQGFSWSFAAGDEDQDMIDRHDDIEARGRAAKIVNGIVRYKQVRTMTPKDSAANRTHNERVLGSGAWGRMKMLGRESPFVGASHWERLRRTMSPREFARRVEAQDLPPELAVYYGWDRTQNLVTRPRIATDVTAEILSDFQSYVVPGAQFALLGCHDPGNIYNSSLALRLIMFGDVPTWLVVGELQTKQTTARDHARQWRAFLQERFEVDLDDGNGRPDPESPKAATFCDPHGKGDGDTDYQTVYMAMTRVGIDVFSPSKKRIKRSARVAMINRLLCDATNTRRLLVAMDPATREPCAPRLVEAFESLQKKPGDDDPEGSQSKDADDQTHLPAALGYGLWLFEQEAYTTETIQRARKAAARRLA